MIKRLRVCKTDSFMSCSRFVHNTNQTSTASGLTLVPFFVHTHRTRCETMLRCVHYLVNVYASLSALNTLHVSRLL